MNRKDFIRTSSVLAASSLFFKAKGGGFFDQSIRVGLVGVNGMGWSDLNALLKNQGVVCTALCDVDERILEQRAKELASGGSHVETFID